MATDAPSSATVLVVDDDQGLSRLIQRALQREGFAVAAASSGKEAIAWLGQHRGDLMLLDLKLQDIEGKELIHALADLHRSLPFIVITGQGDERVAVEMMKRGALDYLVKDVEFLQFLPEVVRRALAGIDKDKRLTFAEEQARLTQTVVEQSYTAVMITLAGTADPGICYVNPAFTRLTGEAPEKVIGRCFSEVETFGERCPELQRALGGDQPWNGELLIRGAGNTRRTVQCSLAPVLDPQGAQTHWTVNFHDVTERRRLESELLEISDRERQRIGRDLHDGLGQQLTAIELMCHSIREDLAAGHPQLEQQAAKMGEFLREAIAQTRALSHGLAPVKLEAAALMDALGELARTTSGVSKVHCRFICAMPVLMTDSTISGHLYRVAQEAVNNALKHGHARKIEIELSRRDENTVRLRISDDGSGLPKSRKTGSGMGLEVMKYRANILGGTLAIESQPGQGVSVQCTAPLKKS